MPKSYSQNLIEKEAEPKRESETKKEPETKRVTSLTDAKVKITGKYSGREYLFDRAGSEIDVDKRDVEWMLGLRQGERQCCGGTDRGNKMFDLTQG